MMDPVKKLEYDAKYAEELYLRYMESGKQSVDHIDELSNRIKDSTVLIIGPAMSSKTEKEKIMRYTDSKIIVVSVNHAYPYRRADFIFVGNMRRFEKLSAEDKERSIVTSNIITDQAYARVDYRSLLTDEEIVRDNAGLMAINLFHSLGASKIVLAGFDGYSLDSSDNYADSRMVFITKKAIFEERNLGMSKVLGQMKKTMDLQFLTKPRHYSIDF